MFDTPLCKYSNMFGAPQTGLHSIRLFGVAIVDVIFVFVAAYVLAIAHPAISYNVYLISLFVMGIIAHRLFCVRTTIDQVLFGSSEQT